MARKTDNLKLPVALICALLFAILLCGCSASGSTPSSSASQSEADASESVSTASASSSSGLRLFGSNEDENYITVVNKFDYSSGIHHAELVFEGYEDQPIEIEIYAHSAPYTASKFCTLVDKGYYNGKPVFWILNEMYMRVGNPEQDNRQLITGEYEESGITNSNSLKRGVLALNRAEDGQQSDASSFFICMSDLSYLDSKYAAFAKITRNYEVVENIASRILSDDETMKIEIDDTGRVLDEMRAPHILSIAMVD